METITQPNEGFLQAKQPWLRTAGIISLFIYAFFWLLNIEISRIGESLMILFFLVMLFTNKPKFLLKEPILYLLIAWVIFQFSVYQWSSSIFPELADEHITEARHLTKIFLFVVVAWWLGGNAKLMTITLFLCCAGFLIAGVLQENGLIDEWKQFLSGKRIALGYRNKEHASVYSAFALITLLTFRNRISGYSLGTKYYLFTKTVTYIGIVFSTIAIIITQTRATWLGLTIAGFTSMVVFLIWKYRIKRLSRQNKITNKAHISKTAIFLTAILAITLFIGAKPIVERRLASERQVINDILKGEINDIKLTSIGVRIRLWETAFGWFAQRPTAGWGPKSRKTLIQQSDFPVWMKKKFGHLHNSYIELLISYGVIGLSLFAGLFMYVWYRTIQCWKRGQIPNDIMLFALTWSTYWLVVNCFESYVIYNETGKYLNALIAGVMYSYHLSHIGTREQIPLRGNHIPNII